MTRTELARAGELLKQHDDLSRMIRALEYGDFSATAGIKAHNGMAVPPDHDVSLLVPKRFLLPVVVDMRNAVSGELVTLGVEP